MREAKHRTVRVDQTATKHTQQANNKRKPWQHNKQSVKVPDSDASDAKVCTQLVQSFLHCSGNTARALVQNGKVWFVEEESSHGKALSLPKGQLGLPVCLLHTWIDEISKEG